MTGASERARELLADIAYRNDCQESTRDDIADAPDDIALGMIRVKASDAVEAMLATQAAAFEDAARWHDQRRRDTPDAFDMEFHEISAKAIRALSPAPAQPIGARSPSPAHPSAT